MSNWYRCPYCGKKLFPIREDTEIKNMPYKCKDNRCGKEILINVKNGKTTISH